MVAVSKPVETDSPVTGQWIKISATKITLLGYADPAHRFLQPKHINSINAVFGNAPLCHHTNSFASGPELRWRLAE